MFAWLFKKTPKDLWEYGHGYVADFRKELDDIAQLLSRDSRHIVRTRFNRSRACAELYTDSGEVVALVRVHGEMSRGNTAHVTCNLSESSKKCFGLLELKSLEVKFYEFSC